MTINVTMIRTALGADDRQWRAGDTYAAENDFARALIGRGDAYAADGSPEDVAPVLDSIIAEYQSKSRKRTKAVRVATFGDSTAVAGTFQNTPTATSHDMRRMICDAWNSGTKTFNASLEKFALPMIYQQCYLVGSGGVSGEKTTAMLARDTATAANDRFAVTDIINLAPDVVILRAGVNDITAVSAGTLAAVVAATHANRMTLIDRFRSAGVFVIDEGIYGRSDSPTDLASVRSAVLQINALAAAHAAANTGTVKFIDWVGTLSESTGALLSEVSYDGLHLNTVGQLRAAAKEAEVLEAMFGASAGMRYPGYNYVTNALMTLQSASNATGYTLAGTNATVGSKAIESVNGKIMQTAVWTITAGSNTCIINFPFDPSGTGAINIATGELLGMEFDLFVQGVGGFQPSFVASGLFGQARFVNTTGSGDVYMNAISAPNAWQLPAEGIAIHVSLPPILAGADAAALTTGSRYQVQLKFSDTSGAVKIGVGNPRIVKLVAAEYAY